MAQWAVKMWPETSSRSHSVPGRRISPVHLWCLWMEPSSGPGGWPWRTALPAGPACWQNEAGCSSQVLLHPGLWSSCQWSSCAGDRCCPPPRGGGPCSWASSTSRTTGTAGHPCPGVQPQSSVLQALSVEAQNQGGGADVVPMELHEGVVVLPALSGLSMNTRSSYSF